MNLLVFPGICLYFMIGAFLGKLATADPCDDELNYVVWFVFWPFVIIIIFGLLLGLLLMVVFKRLSKILIKFHRYFNTF